MDVLSLDFRYKRCVSLSWRIAVPGGGLKIPCSYLLFGPREKKGLNLFVLLSNSWFWNLMNKVVAIFFSKLTSGLLVAVISKKNMKKSPIFQAQIEGDGCLLQHGHLLEFLWYLNFICQVGVMKIGHGNTLLCKFWNHWVKIPSKWKLIG